MYQENSRRFLIQAWSQLKRGDLQQAIEKGWASAAQIVKAIAHQNGWPHNSHATLCRAVRQLTESENDANIYLKFAVAGNLHTNFYQNWQLKESIHLFLKDIEEFVTLLHPLIKKDN